MWEVVLSDKFRRDPIYQEITEAWKQVWENVISFQQIKNKKIKDLSDKIIELINQIVSESIEEFERKIWETKTKKMNQNDLEQITKDAKDIFNEMLLKALLFNEKISKIAESRNITLNDEQKLLYIKDMLLSYKEIIINLLENFTKK